MFLEIFLKRGEKLQMWLNKFKVALVEKNVDTINKLLDDIPEFSLDQAQQASYLMREAATLLYSLQDEITASKKQIKQNINFLKSSTSATNGSKSYTSLNIKS